MLQVWAYYHLLDDRELTLRAWGVHDARVATWQRHLVKWLFPVQARLIRRAFRVGPESYERARTEIERLLSDIDSRLAGRESVNSILGDEVPNYTDYTFAALSSVWALPPNMAHAKAPLLDVAELPAAMRKDIEAFRDRHPAASAFVDRLYRNDRDPPGERGQGDT